MKKVCIFAGALLILIIVTAGMFMALYKPKRYSDFGVFTDLETRVITLLQTRGAEQRPVTRYFKDFTVGLSLVTGKVFGSSVAGIPLKSFETERIAAATVSHFELPPGSSYYRDFTLNVRPGYAFKAPVLHIDFMKPMPGFPGMCVMDFFNADTDSISWDVFFGAGLAGVKKALLLVEKYQRTVEDGRGKITGYLDPHKSPYRFELKEPETNDEDIRRVYYETVQDAIELVLQSYFTSLDRLVPEAAYAARHEKKIQELLQLFYSNDIAVSMGRKMLGDDFKKYWLDGFWNVQMELQE